jgi:starch phosphorylase
MAKSKKTAARRTALSASSGVRTGMTAADLRQAFLDHLLCTLGRVPMAATPNDAYIALALAVRDRVLARGVRTTESYIEADARLVAYLSAEYLPGPHLENNLLSLGIREATAGRWRSSG